MAVFGTTLLTHIDVIKRLGVSGFPLEIAETLAQINEIEMDAHWEVGNRPDGHEMAQRTALPTPYYMRLNQGTPVSSSDVIKVVEPRAVVKSFRRVHDEVARISGHSERVISDEDKSHVIACSNKMMNALFYDNEATTPSTFSGFATRMSALAAGHVLGAGGTQTDLTSIYLVGWGPAGTFLFSGAGDPGGYSINDLGEVEVNDASGNPMVCFDAEHRYGFGVGSADIKSCGRIANIDTSVALAGDTQNLIGLMTQMLYNVPGYLFPQVRLVFYMNRIIAGALQSIGATKTIYTTTLDGLGGRPVQRIAGYPVRICEAISGTETVVV